MQGLLGLAFAAMMTVATVTACGGRVVEPDAGATGACCFIDASAFCEPMYGLQSGGEAQPSYAPCLIGATCSAFEPSNGWIRIGSPSATSTAATEGICTSRP